MAALVRPVIGRLGRGGLSVPAGGDAPQEAGPAESAAEDGTGMPAAELQQLWQQAAASFVGSRVLGWMQKVTPMSLRGNTLTVRQSGEQVKMVQSLVTDPKVREKVEDALKKVVGRPMRLEMESGAERLVVQVLGGPARGHAAADREERPQAVPAPAAGEGIEIPPDSDSTYSDAELLEALERAAPPSRKLQSLLERDEEMRRAVALMCDLTKGRVIRLNGEPL